MEQLTFTLEAEEDHAGLAPYLVVTELQLFHQALRRRKDDLRLVGIDFRLHPPGPGRVDIVVVAKLLPFVNGQI